MEPAVHALLALTFKHFVCDFPLQTEPWMWANKGTYGHPGGIAHSATHLIGTLIVFSVFDVDMKLVYAASVIDFVAHYHIDWAKMNIGKTYGLHPATRMFWVLLGFDQLLHMLTYFALVSFVHL